MKHLFFLFLFCSLTTVVLAQADSSVVKKAHTSTHRDSVYMAKLNSNGNLMIAAGVGLTGIGGYLVYQGYKVYTTKSTVAGEEERNRKQGTIYYVAAGVGIAGGIILTAIGAKNKVEFKQRKRLLEMESGLLDNGRLGLALNF
jgi:uncharacterized membrane protein